MGNELPKRMTALVAFGPGDYRLERDWPVPECGPDDIILKTEGCGICSSDLKCLHGAPQYWGDEATARWVDPPFIPGHEFLGRVAAVGENVRGYALGERLTCDQIAPCGECRFCRNGQYWMCQPHRMYGYFKEYNGAMAEYVRIRTKHAVISRIPDSIPLESAVLIEPYACARHAVDRAAISHDDVVVLAGAGTLGLGMINAIRRCGPRELIVLDMKEERLALAKEFGADQVWNPGKMDVVQAVMDRTEGYGCDVYIEATGHPNAVVQGMHMIRKLGTFVEFSVFSQPTTLDWSIIGDRKELDVLGAHISPHTYPVVIEGMANGTIQTKGVVTKMFPLEEWETAFGHAAGNEGDIKVAFRFD